MSNTTCWVGCSGVNERWDYKTLRDIRDRTYPERVAYYAGEGIMAQVVQDWGLVLGEDVAPARPGLVQRPAGNAKRDDWVAFRLAQGVPVGDVQDLGRDDLRDMPDPQGQEEEPPPAPEEVPAEDTTDDAEAEG